MKWIVGTWYKTLSGVHAKVGDVPDIMVPEEEWRLNAPENWAYEGYVLHGGNQLPVWWDEQGRNLDKASMFRDQYDLTPIEIDTTPVPTVYPLLQGVKDMADALSAKTMLCNWQLDSCVADEDGVGGDWIVRDSEGNRWLWTFSAIPAPDNPVTPD